MISALELYVAMALAGGAGFLLCAFFGVGSRSDDAKEIARLRIEKEALLDALASRIKRDDDFPPEAFT